MECFAGLAFGAAASSLLVSLRQNSSCARIEMTQRMQTSFARESFRAPEANVYTRAQRERNWPRSRTAASDCLEDVKTPWQRGVSEDEARDLIDAAAAKSKEKTASEVLDGLQRGNARFWTGNATRPEKNAFERRSLIMKQFPSVAVLGCSDSRVPVEIVFDQGLGDMFVVRVAGNCLDMATSASLEYAVHHLNVKVVVVMGHEGCGAVKAAGLPIDQIDKESDALSKALKNIKSGLDEQRLMHVRDARAYDREAVVTNVKRQVLELTKDQAFAAKIRSQEIILIGAFYEISSGIVDFFCDASELVDASDGLTNEQQLKVEC